MKQKTQKLIESVKKKLQQQQKSSDVEQTIFDHDWIIKYFGKPSANLYRDYYKSMISNTKIKIKKKGKKHYLKKVR